MSIKQIIYFIFGVRPERKVVMTESNAKDQHALVKLRKIVGVSQRNLHPSFTSPYIGAVERGKSKLSKRFSEALMEKYGAWIAPGLGATEVYQAFGEEWNAAQDVVREQKTSTILKASDYGDTSEILATCRELEANLVRKKSVRGLRIVASEPPLKPYTYESYERHRQKKVPEPVGVSPGEREKLHQLLDIVLILGSSGEQSLSLSNEVSNALSQVIESNGLEKVVKKEYECKASSILDLFPAKNEKGLGFASRLLEAAKLQGAPSFPGRERGESFIDSLPTFVSYENFRDWSRSSMDMGQWEMLLDEAEATAHDV